MSNRSHADLFETAVEEHLQAAAELMIAKRKAVDPSSAVATIIERLDLILQTLGTSAEYPVMWVKLAKYVELTGDSTDSVHARRQVGKWLDGQQCKLVGGTLWVDLRAAQRWVEDWHTSPLRKFAE